MNYTCDILTQAFVRYRKIIGTLTVRKFKTRLSTINEMEGKKKKSWRSDPQFEGNLEVVHVNLKNPCETKPYLGMDESCKYTILISVQFLIKMIKFPDTLSIIESEATLESFSIWGILRGLESFSQLLFVNEKDLAVSYKNKTTIQSFIYTNLITD